ncbi:MAG: hypothetical protein NE327_14240 [Lentisphaeraceae bacterium]|nr:hypothetical protein [Lentisphaeraceae bacterium]
MKPLEEIFAIKDKADFTDALFEYVWDLNEPGSIGEYYLDLVNRFDTGLNINGLSDIFYQEFSLKEINDLLHFFNEIGLLNTYSLVNEALNIYCLNRTNIGQEEYENLDPFSLLNGERFDEIEQEINNDDSDYHNLRTAIFNWVKLNKIHFIKKL